MQSDKFFEGYKEYINMYILLKQYIKEKGIHVIMTVNKNPFKKHKEITIFPIKFG